MLDPRQTVHHPAEDRQEFIRRTVHAHLVECTENASNVLGCSGASFVMMAIGIWVAELSEVDRAKTAELLNALADFAIAEDDHSEATAERRRRAAVEDLHHAVDLAMSEHAGSA